MSETAHRLGALNVGTLEAKLCGSAVAFANTPRGVRINDQRVMVSKIYDRLPVDCGGLDKAVLQHILQYARDDLLPSLWTNGKIHDMAYGWRLNNAK